MYNINKYETVLKKALKAQQINVTDLYSQKLYDALENDNEHSLCALIDALSDLKKNETDLIALSLAETCTLLIDNDYFETIKLDSEIRQRLIFIRQSISVGRLESTVKELEKKHAKKVKS